VAIENAHQGVFNFIIEDSEWHIDKGPKGFLASVSEELTKHFSVQDSCVELRVFAHFEGAAANRDLFPESNPKFTVKAFVAPNPTANPPVRGAIVTDVISPLKESTDKSPATTRSAFRTGSAVGFSKLEITP
jgi:hypothetical protein